MGGRGDGRTGGHGGAAQRPNRVDRDCSRPAGCPCRRRRTGTAVRRRAAVAPGGRHRLPWAHRLRRGRHHLPQLDYWARTALVEPTIRGARGSGTQRLYSFRDILVLKVVKRLLDTGVSLHNIRTAVEHLRRRGVDDLARITLMSDGTTVYECTSPDEVVDLVQGGQGVFGIAVGRVVREVEGSLAQFPGERADDDAA